MVLIYPLPRSAEARRGIVFSDTGTLYETNLMSDVIPVGAAFQPRLNDYGVNGTCFRGGKPLPR